MDHAGRLDEGTVQPSLVIGRVSQRCSPRDRLVILTCHSRPVRSSNRTAPARTSGRLPRGYRCHTKEPESTRRSGGSHWGSQSDVAVASDFYIYMAGQQRVDGVLAQLSLPVRPSVSWSGVRPQHRGGFYYPSVGSPPYGRTPCRVTGDQSACYCLASFITRSIPPLPVHITHSDEPPA